MKTHPQRNKDKTGKKKAILVEKGKKDRNAGAPYARAFFFFFWRGEVLSFSPREDAIRCSALALVDLQLYVRAVHIVFVLLACCFPLPSLLLLSEHCGAAGKKKKERRIE